VVHMEAMQAGCVTEQCYLLFVVGHRNADCGSIRGGWKLAISFGKLEDYMRFSIHNKLE